MSKHEMPVSRREPAVIIGAIVGFVAAVLTAIVAFGVEITPEQRDAVLGVVVAAAGLVPLVQALLTRTQVWSSASVAKLEDEAVARGVRIQAQASAVLQGAQDPLEP